MSSSERLFESEEAPAETSGFEEQPAPEAGSAPAAQAEPAPVPPAEPAAP
jgi:hypothetical protein